MAAAPSISESSLRIARLPNAPNVGSPWLRVWLAPLLLVVLALVGLLWLDMPLARWSKATKPPGVLQELYDVAEAFGNGIGILLVAWAITEFDQRHRGRLVRVVVLGLGAGLMANALKMLIVRARPRNFDLSIDNAFVSFGQWFPFLGEASGDQSFPSAHTATAVGLALALCSIYPQARRLAFALVAIVGLARIGGTAHFFSDVCIGAAVGWLFAAAWLHIPRLRARLERSEARVGRLFNHHAATAPQKVSLPQQRRAA